MRNEGMHEGRTPTHPRNRDAVNKVALSCLDRTNTAREEADAGEFAGITEPPYFHTRPDTFSSRDKFNRYFREGIPFSIPRRG